MARDHGRRAVATYAPVQIWIHWLTALCIFGLVAAGLTMTRIGPGTLTNALYELHKSFGLIVVALVVLRFVARAVHGAPEHAPMPGWQLLAARISHVALYLLIVIVPLSGWAATSACCAPVNLFWSIDLTLPVARGFDVARPIFVVHNWAAYLLVFVVLIHAGAALQHHYLRRDDTLARMTGGRARRVGLTRP
ncbi:cytochrome b [Salinarimonas ramus]|uniref:Cytochrome b n=1 Tax=Salinarimonas ramus TaxID=690164 RepID=A0A917V9B6_9HYPH|nr:cytochrome b [Salinarimonas ramus]GGK52521.1 cytochrome b [Salinarimonas ramus]